MAHPAEVVVAAPALDSHPDATAGRTPAVVQIHRLQSTAPRGLLNGLRFVRAKAGDVVASLAAGLRYVVLPVPLDFDFRASDFEIGSGMPAIDDEEIA